MSLEEKDDGVSVESDGKEGHLRLFVVPEEQDMGLEPTLNNRDHEGDLTHAHAADG